MGVVCSKCCGFISGVTPLKSAQNEEVRKISSDSGEPKYCTLTLDSSRWAEKKGCKKVKNDKLRSPCSNKEKIIPPTPRLALIPRPLSLKKSLPGLITPVELYTLLTEVEWDSPLVHREFYLLVIDTRPLEEYHRQHIMSAQHLTKILREANQLRRYQHVVVYHGKHPPAEILDDLSSSLYGKLRHHKTLDSSFHEFCKQYPFLCSGEQYKELKTLPVYPSLVIEPWLFQGTMKQAGNPDMMKAMGITHIVNITKDQKCLLANVEYLHIRLADNITSQIIDHLDTIVEFVHCAYERKGKVLLHCNMGISRSSTACLAYLMNTFSCSLLDAFNLLKTRRNASAPNKSFMLQLEAYEEHLFGEQLTDATELWLSY